MIKVLIVDDSKVVQEFMKHLLSSDPEIHIVGVANSGLEALKLVEKKRPDVITMDVHMPEMDGYEATRAIMETFPTPIVIISGSLQVTELANSFKLIEAGALSIVVRPPGMNNPEFKSAHQNLIKTIKLMSEVKVVRRFPRRSSPGLKDKILPSDNGSSPDNDYKIIVIGASTGGPAVLQTILSNLPDNLPVPVVIVQHIAKGFIQGFKNWLSLNSNIPVLVANDGEKLIPGKVYIAPEDYHMGITRDFRTTLHKEIPENGMCPSIDFLFRSVAKVAAKNAIGILLTGMGKDGAMGLKNMKENGATTIAQDEASSTIFGMPREAIKMGAACQILPSGKIAEALVNLLQTKK